MQLDPDNQVVKLCVAGMQAEQEHRLATACGLFIQAWDARQNDLEACIAAHYLARHQTELERILHWNLVALRHADAARAPEDAPDIAGFYPSLYLNVGNSYEQLGDHATARHYYQQAVAGLELLQSDYGDVVRRGVAAGLQRTLST
jgi:tetratricopeptide (TPR) repeat protein